MVNIQIEYVFSELLKGNKMNIEDVVDVEYGLQESASQGLKFGQYGQLSVCGWSGTRGTNKRLILFCEICSLDSELFGQGYFCSFKSDLNRGNLPCGCSNITKWTRSQYELLLHRAARDVGVSFVSFSGDFCGAKTRLTLCCPDHGEYEIKKASYLLNRKQKGCKLCKAEGTSARLKKSDVEMIDSFMSSGSFPEGTKFTRSDRTNSYGYKTYWTVYCPICVETVTAYFGSLQNGSIPCACKTTKQTRAYISVIKDGIRPVGLKFGVARNPERRLKEQQIKTIYKLESYGFWEFPSEAMCLGAERLCKKNIICSVIPKEEMLDGYTETCFVNNLDTLISIYESCGGTNIFMSRTI